MAEETKKEVTPEEKLLKVIQGSREKKPDAAPAAAAVPVAPATAAAPASAAKEPAPLKLATPAAAKPAPAPKTATPVSAGAPSAEAKTAGGGALPALARNIRRRAVINGWRVTNRVLLGVIILMMALISLEIRGGIVSIGMLGQSPVEMPVVKVDAVKEYTPAVAPLGQLIKIPGAKIDDAAKAAAQQADWHVYARNNMKYIGTSQVGNALEAVVHDKKTGKMHYLRTGAVLRIEDRDISVVEVQGEAIVLTDGEEKMPLK